MIPTLIGFSIGGSSGFPDAYKFADINDQSYVVPNTLTDNVVELHKFLYGDTVQYWPSSEVEYASTVILDKAAAGSLTATYNE